MTYIRVELRSDRGTTSCGVEVEDVEKIRPILMLIETICQHMNITMHWFIPELKESKKL